MDWDPNLRDLDRGFLCFIVPSHAKIQNLGFFPARLGFSLLAIPPSLDGRPSMALLVVGDLDLCRLVFACTERPRGKIVPCPRGYEYQHTYVQPPGVCCRRGGGYEFRFDLAYSAFSGLVNPKGSP